MSAVESHVAVVTDSFKRHLKLLLLAVLYRTHVQQFMFFFKFLIAHCAVDSVLSSNEVDLVVTLRYLNCIRMHMYAHTLAR